MKDGIKKALTKNQSLTIMELNDRLGLTTIDEYQRLQKDLDELVSDGVLYYSEKKKKYLLLENSHLNKGKLILNAKGFGFIEIGEGYKDVYINPKNINGAISGDFVLFDYLNKDKTRPEGKIVKVIKRNYDPVVGEIILKDGEYFLVPDKKSLSNIYIPRCNLNGAVEGHKVLVTPLKDGKRIGEVTKIIGHKNDVGVDILSFVFEYDFRPEFSPEVMEELEDIPQFLSEDDVNSELEKGRRDLRNKVIFTIDGADTKDIDDAISLEKDGNTYVLGVHIADVSHYVKVGTKIDEEAYFRATSVYLVDRVLPMLPHKLSNGICSLNENEDRFTMSCEMKIDDKGNVIKYDIFPSIIRSRKKMTYENVNKILEEDIVPEGYEPYTHTLKLMEELSIILREKMVSRGYIEFESSEAKIYVDERCHPTKIEARVQRAGEELIENFMIAANETVASSIFYRNLPGIYRVHDVPNEKRLDQFLKFISLHGYVVRGKNKIKNPRDLQNILKQLGDYGEMKILHDMAIRAQAKAVYSDVNIGHFGLGSKCYSHFTSPIRRYPDLILHRLIKDYNYNYSEDVVNKNRDALPMLSEHCSIREQHAQNCERDVDKMKKAEYMMDHIGEVYEGIISGVQEFGMFVELENTVEGLVKVQTMENDYYALNKDLMALVGKRTGKKYSFGDTVKVKVVSANKENSTVDFEIYNPKKETRKSFRK